MKVLPKALLALGVISSAVYYLLPAAKRSEPPPPIILEITPPSSDTITFNDQAINLEALGNGDLVEGKPDASESSVSADSASGTRSPDSPDAVEESLDFSESLSIQSDATPDTAADKAGAVAGWHEHKVRSGDTLARVFDRFGLSATTLNRLLDTDDETKRLANLQPGQVISIRLNNQGELEELVHERSSIARLHVFSDSDGFASEVEEKSLEVRVENAAATIDSSLFADGQDAGLSNKVIMELAELFNWDIDFARELQTGDRFAVIFESHYLDGEKYDDGEILAAEFVNQGTSYRALRYQDPKGVVDYYSPDGSSKKKAFIKTPVKFGRISSGFSKRRWHPVLKRWRSHKGVDYAAPTGTPIRAAGKGSVSFAGRQRGYGKVVYLKHGDRYTTVYGHMSKFAKGLEKGDTVKQGQVIGYVGKTGLATGPHLHYEFRVDGKHVDPLSHKLPTAMPLPKQYMADFHANTESLVQQLNMMSAPRIANRH